MNCIQDPRIWFIVWVAVCFLGCGFILGFVLDPKKWGAYTEEYE